MVLVVVDVLVVPGVVAVAVATEREVDEGMGEGVKFS